MEEAMNAFAGFFIMIGLIVLGNAIVLAARITKGLRA